MGGWVGVGVRFSEIERGSDFKTDNFKKERKRDRVREREIEREKERERKRERVSECVCVLFQAHSVH